jgi:hypothetical protein
MMDRSPHDSNQNPQDNFETSQSSEDNSGDNNAVAKLPIPSKDMTSGTSTPAAKEPEEPSANKSHKSHRVSDTPRASTLTAEDGQIISELKLCVVNRLLDLAWDEVEESYSRKDGNICWLELMIFHNLLPLNVPLKRELKSGIPSLVHVLRVGQH